MSSNTGLIPTSLIQLQDIPFLVRMMVRLYQSPNNSILIEQLKEVLHTKYGAQDVSALHLSHLRGLLELVVYSNSVQHIPSKYGGIVEGTALHSALEQVVGTLREQDSNFIKIPYMKRVIGLQGKSVLREHVGAEQARGHVVWRGTWHCVDGDTVSMEMDRATIETVLKGMQKIKTQLKLLS